MLFSVKDLTYCKRASWPVFLWRRDVNVNANRAERHFTDATGSRYEPMADQSM